MKKPRITLVAGARPNFMKIAPIIRELQTRDASLEWSLVHTGQHYDREMSDVFFRDLGIPTPELAMAPGGGTHSEQTARIMLEFERYCLESKPDMVVVVGDVNSTLACSIVAKKLGIKVAHVEAGLRSGDMNMPEEVNRIVTDSISDLFFVTEQSGLENLIKEGHSPNAIHFVGHVMIDNLFYQMKALEKTPQERFETAPLKTQLQTYGVVTLHRPSNVDDPSILKQIMSALDEVGAEIPLVFPVHPRTRANLASFNIRVPAHIHLLAPLPYMEFLNLWKDAKLLLTDSGGLQEESTALGIPCLTLRNNTERPITIEEGTNILVGTNERDIVKAAKLVLAGRDQRGNVRPKFWDGRSSARIADVLESVLLHQVQLHM